MKSKITPTPDLEEFKKILKENVEKAFSDMESENPLIQRFVKYYSSFGSGFQFDGFGTSIDLEDFYFNEFAARLTDLEFLELLHGLSKFFKFRKLTEEREHHSYKGYLDRYGTKEQLKHNESIGFKEKVYNIEKFELESKYFESTYEFNKLIINSDLLSGRTKKKTFNAKEKYFILKKLDFWSSSFFIGLTSESQKEFVSDLLDINIRTAQGLINGESKYSEINRERKIEIEDYYINLKK